MIIFKSIDELNKKIKFTRNIGFVPTMGAIHKGHISLVKKSIQLSNKTIVSIFINKPQFNKKNDFKKYPRKLDHDIRLLKDSGVDFLYIPSFKQIYPAKVNKK